MIIGLAEMLQIAICVCSSTCETQRWPVTLPSAPPEIDPILSGATLGQLNWRGAGRRGRGAHSSMSMSCQWPGPANGWSERPYSPQWSMIEPSDFQLHWMSSQFLHPLQPYSMKVAKGWMVSLPPLMYAGQEQEYSIGRPVASSAAPIALYPSL